MIDHHEKPRLTVCERGFKFMQDGDHSMKIIKMNLGQGGER